MIAILSFSNVVMAGLKSVLRRTHRSANALALATEPCFGNADLRALARGRDGSLVDYARACGGQPGGGHASVAGRGPPPRQVRAVRVHAAGSRRDEPQRGGL